LAARAEKTRTTKRNAGGRPPKVPVPGPRDTDQYNFTDPESRMTPAPPQVRVKNSHNAAFDQHYNAQVAVDQASFLIVAQTLSNHPVDQSEALPTVAAIPGALGTPPAVALDVGDFSVPNILGLEARGIAPYIATGREPHARNWQTFFAQPAAPPPAEARPTVKMAYKLQTEIGKAIYRLRKCTVEPVTRTHRPTALWQRQAGGGWCGVGIIKEVLGFRQFSLRGLAAAAGEWCLVCLAFNLKRLHVLIVD